MKWWAIAVCLLIAAESGIAQATSPAQASSAVAAAQPPIAAEIPAPAADSAAYFPSAAIPVSDLPAAPVPAKQLLAAAIFPAPPAIPSAPEPAFSAAAYPLPQLNTLPDFAALPQQSPALSPTLSPITGLPAIRLQDCPTIDFPAPECRIRWGHLAIEASLWLLFQNAGNVYTSYFYRTETTQGKWWDRYVNSVEGWRWNRWDDNNPFLDAYIAHPIMGSITNYIWIQNDPRSMTVTIGNTPQYWNLRLRALAFSTFYSFEWKLGPVGEASIGHNGDHYYYDNGAYTNETGWVELVTTPIGGALWSVTEDLLDKHIITRLEHKSHNPFALLSYGMLNPTRSVANMLRFRPPWYRDTRVVRAKSFWDEPGGGTSLEDREEDVTDPAALAASRRAAEIPEWPHLGGVHEFGAWWGFSVMTGHLWGSASDIKTMPIVVKYSYLLSLRDHWQLRYSPELTALTLIDWPTPGNSNIEQERKRAYGAGLSPLGFQLSAFPTHRFQPFLSTNSGVIYYDQRTLAPQGSLFMVATDFGAGVTIFRKAREAVTIGYRYQHQSNYGIAAQNPATDANIFYVGASLFRSRGYR